jgi:hypothetical protein
MKVEDGAIRSMAPVKTGSRRSLTSASTASSSPFRCTVKIPSYLSVGRQNIQPTRGLRRMRTLRVTVMIRIRDRDRGDHSGFAVSSASQPTV